jgi:hypothetical protein
MPIDVKKHCHGSPFFEPDARVPATSAIEAPTEDGSIQFRVVSDKLTPVLELKANGDILVRGKLIENDKELVDGLREWFRLAKIERGKE